MHPSVSMLMPPAQHSPESSCRPYSQTLDVIYEIVERYVEAMHAFLSFAKAG
jgi:hypothetical protein